MVRPIKKLDMDHLDEMIYSNPAITLRHAAKEVNCSHQTLLARIKRYLGMSFIDYKNELLTKALKLRRPKIKHSIPN